MSRIKCKNRKGWTMEVHESMEAADDADRERQWSRTPAQRLRELERLRQLNYGYGPGKPRPKFQRVLRIAKLGEG
jgi:hypothetical protein